MTTGPVLLDVSHGVGHIRLNAPSTGNALDLRMATDLDEAFRRVAEDDAVRVVLLSGAGRVFCAGGDLRSVQAADDRAAFALSLAEAAHQAVRRMARLGKPIVTAVGGSAAGAGLSLVLLSDIVVAATGSTFTTAYTRMGLTPDCGQSWLLPRAVGTVRALDLVLQSRPVSAGEAQAMGLITRVVDDSTELAVATAFATRLADGPAHAHGQARALIRRSTASGFDAHLQLEAETIAAAAATPDAVALVDAFVDRSTALSAAAGTTGGTG